MSLDRPLAVFREKQEKFATEHYGKYVVIHKDTVVEFYDEQLDAYLEAKDKFAGGSFLIRKCVPPEEETVAILRSRAA